MRREEITEAIDTRRVVDGHNEYTMSASHQIWLGEELGEAVLSVEYKPAEFRIDDRGLEPLAGTTLFDGEDRPPEAVVSDLYWALVDLLYPSSAYLEEPWERLPMVVELERSTDISDWYVSLGAFR